MRDQVFYSASLQREMHYRALLPREYTAARRRLPVLYLLHGLNSSSMSWDSFTHLQNYARDLPLLIVMPDAEDSWYTNSVTIVKDRFEDYVVKDVVSQIDRQYRTIPGRSGRAISGMSMGGYGAIKLALKYPELFSFSGSIGGVVAPEDLDPLRPRWGPKRVEVFGPRAIMQRDGNSIFWLLEALGQRPSPYFYLACGTEDWNIDANRAFVLQLASRKLTYEYRETLGGHTWEYWDHALQPMLLAASRALAGGAATRRMPRRLAPLTYLSR